MCGIVGLEILLLTINQAAARTTITSAAKARKKNLAFLGCTFGSTAFCMVNDAGMIHPKFGLAENYFFPFKSKTKSFVPDPFTSAVRPEPFGFAYISGITFVDFCFFLVSIFE